jgi:hypothetical protein
MPLLQARVVWRVELALAVARHSLLWCSVTSVLHMLELLFD